MRIFGIEITRASEKRAAKKDYPEQVWGLGEETSSGESMDDDKAMRLATVYRCVKVLAETVSATPTTLYEESDDGEKSPAKDVDIYDLFKYQPNEHQSPAEFKGQMQSHVSLNGNGFAEIIFKGERIVALEPFEDPRKMDVVKLPNGRLAYKYWDGAKPRVLRQDQVFHLRGVSRTGIRGLSPIAELRELMGYQRAMEKHASKFFMNSARIGGVLKYPGKLTKTAIQNLRDSWQRQYGGQDNAHKTAILEQGMEYQGIAMTMEDAQFIDQEKLSEAQLAGAFRVPLHLIGNYDKATFSNIEHLSLEYIQFTMLPLYTFWQEAVARCLMTAEQQKRYKLEFDYEVFLRGDALARANTSNIMRNAGVINADEWRKSVGMNPIKKKGDVNGEGYWKPANMSVLGEEPEPVVQQPNGAKGPGTPPGEQPQGSPGQNKPGIATKMVALRPIVRRTMGRALRREEKGGKNTEALLREDLEPLIQSVGEMLCGREVQNPKETLEKVVKNWVMRSYKEPGEKRLETELREFEDEMLRSFGGEIVVFREKTEPPVINISTKPAEVDVNLTVEAPPAPKPVVKKAGWIEKDGKRELVIREES